MRRKRDMNVSYLQALGSRAMSCADAAAQGLLSLCLRCLAAADDDLRWEAGSLAATDWAMQTPTTETVGDAGCGYRVIAECRYDCHGRLSHHSPPS